MPRSRSETMQNQSISVSLKRNRHDNCNTSDTSDGYPSRSSTSEPVADYDFGRLFGYEVFMERDGSDEQDDLNTDRSSECQDDYPSSPSKRNKIRSKRSDSDVGIPLSSLTVNSPRLNPDGLNPPVKDSIHERRDKTNNELENDVTDDNNDTENNNSGTESDSDGGYESDFSYFSVSPVSVAPIISRTVQVLVVDDCLLQRKISRVLLSGKIGSDTWMVNTADSGERAIQVIESSLKIPDILVVDQNMYSSGGSLLGHEVVQKLRENSAFSDMIIIGCTAYADEARKHFFEAGCDAVWNKPMPSKTEVCQQVTEIRLKRELLKKKTSQPDTTERRTSYRGVICPSTDLRPYPLNKNNSNNNVLMDRIFNDAPSSGLFLSENMMV